MIQSVTRKSLTKGFQFIGHNTDGSTEILRKKATRPYTHAAHHVGKTRLGSDYDYWTFHGSAKVSFPAWEMTAPSVFVISDEEARS